MPKMKKHVPKSPTDWDYDDFQNESEINNYANVGDNDVPADLDFLNESNNIPNMSPLIKRPVEHKIHTNPLLDEDFPSGVIVDGDRPVNYGQVGRLGLAGVGIGAGIYGLYRLINYLKNKYGTTTVNPVPSPPPVPPAQPVMPVRPFMPVQRPVTLQKQKRNKPRSKWKTNKRL